MLWTNRQSSLSHTHTGISSHSGIGSASPECTDSASVTQRCNTLLIAIWRRWKIKRLKARQHWEGSPPKTDTNFKHVPKFLAWFSCLDCLPEFLAPVAVVGGVKKSCVLVLLHKSLLCALQDHGQSDRFALAEHGLMNWIKSNHTRRRAKPLRGARSSDETGVYHWKKPLSSRDAFCPI